MEYGVNINGDMDMEEILIRAKTARKSGFRYLWIGENIRFRHPFEIIPHLAENTDIKIGTGIISPIINDCSRILEFFNKLKKEHGDRFIAGIAPGDILTLKKLGYNTGGIVKKLFRCAESLRSADIEVFIGCSGPKMISKASEIADGILFNYVHPDYIDWARSYMKEEVYTSAYGPSLLLPDKRYESHLLIASGIVLAGANREFAEHFGITEDVSWAMKLISSGKFSELGKKRDWLFERFTISGNEREILRRINQLEELDVDQVIFGDPMAKKTGNLIKLKKLISRK